MKGLHSGFRLIENSSKPVLKALFTETLTDKITKHKPRIPLPGVSSLVRQLSSSHRNHMTRTSCALFHKQLREE